LDQQRQINDAHCLDSFDAADELAVGCALLDGGDFDGETDLIEGDTVAPPAQQVRQHPLTLLEQPLSQVGAVEREQVESAENDIGAVSAAAEQLNGCAIS
jgi:hypothetical protein